VFVNETETDRTILHTGLLGRIGKRWIVLYRYDKC